MDKSYVFLTLVLIISLTLVSASDTTIGVKKLDDCIDLIQSCADCSYVNFTSYTMPNGTRNVWEVPGVKNGVSFTYYNCSLANQTGTYIIDGHGDVGGKDTVFTYTYEVTTTGNPTPDGMPMFQMGLIILIFGISCFFLYLSFVMGEVGFKIFFMVTSLIFLTASMLTAYMVSMDGNVAAATNSTTLGLVIVLGMVLVIIFFYILIRQTINVLDSFKINKGLKMEGGLGRQVMGHDIRKAY